MTHRPIWNRALCLCARDAAPLAALLLTLGLLGPVAPAAAQSGGLPCPQDRLYNAGLEGGFNARGRQGLQVALGWQPWVRGLDLGVADSGIDFLPLERWRTPDAGQVQQGLWSQGVEGLRVGRAGGLWQRARVPAGERLLVYAWGGVGARTEAPEGNPAQSAAWRLRLGLDPLGGSDPTLARLSWTAPVTLTEGWAPLLLPPLTAEAPTATLFLEGQPVGDAPGSQLRWDSACLGLMDAAAPPIAPSPPPLMTLDPRTPELPPPATLAIILAGQAEATARAAALEARATAWAARPLGLRQSGGALGGSGFVSTGQYGPIPDPVPGRLTLAQRLYDASGLLALLLAALVAGVLVGLRGARGGARSRPDAPR